MTFIKWVIGIMIFLGVGFGVAVALYKSSKPKSMIRIPYRRSR